ncbi:GNAT family N-acetyltransferase [Clostridium saccharoperbutylacetonicum]
MFKPFLREDKVLNYEPFLNYEVQFNLFHYIIEGKEVITLKTCDNNAIAMQNPGHAMWLWVNENLKKSKINEILSALCNQLKESELCSISGKPEFVRSFAEKYSKITESTNKISLGMEAYQCQKIIQPKNVQGKLIKAELSNSDIIIEFWIGFVFDCYGIKLMEEKQIGVVESMIKSGGLYLWKVEAEIVGMVNIAHKTERHARINNVYTPQEQRKKGYASAMVAELCSSILKGGLTPMLYADIKNCDSNKVYKSIGFTESGRIDNIVFDYNL